MIFVTGGTGFLGSHLLMQLCGANRKVRALKRPGSDKGFVKSLFSFYQNEDLFDSIEWVDGDLNDIGSLQNAIQGVDHIYHCAATVTFSARNPDYIFDNNVNGTANLINVALNSAVQRICYVSSISALGNDEIITEKSCWNKENPHSVYGRSKYESEMEAWRGIAEGLDTIIVNPSVIIGPWKNHYGIGSLFQQISSGLKFYTGGSNSFVDVRDVAKLMVLLMDSECKNDNFIISAENVSFRQLLTLIAKIIGVKAPHIKASRLMTDLAWRFATLISYFRQKELNFNKDTARISQSSSVYSNEKIVNALDFTFIPVERSLEHYYNFYKEFYKQTL